MEKPWTGFESQAPDPMLKIYTQGIKSVEADITYSADPEKGAWSKLLNYSFSEGVEDMDGSFSFSVENEDVDNNGKTVFDIIPLRSVVEIFEGDKTRPVFVGIVRRRHLGMAMTGQGIKRTITFTGKSIISCIGEYTVSLDVRIQGIADAMSKTISLTDKLAHDGLTIISFMTETWEHFQEVAKRSGTATDGIANIISEFIGSGPGTFIKNTGSQDTLRYNVACVFYNAANNSILDIWKNILPKPVYEIFSRCEAEGPRVIVRQVPYDPKDWAALDVYQISPISLTSYDLEQSDEEVYTAFVSYIIGSAMSKEFYMAVGQTTGNDSIVEHMGEKQKIYGYKPLEISFNGYDREGNSKDQKKSDLTDALQGLNKKAGYWYSRLDDMYSGSITICTDFNNPETNPRAGCRVKFMDGEFYINKTDHSWTFGGTPTIKLTVSRGMIYDDGGKMRGGDVGVLKNIGRRFRELEEAG